MCDVDLMMFGVLFVSKDVFVAAFAFVVDVFVRAFRVVFLIFLCDVFECDLLCDLFD